MFMFDIPQDATLLQPLAARLLYSSTQSVRRSAACLSIGRAVKTCTRTSRFGGHFSFACVCVLSFAGSGVDTSPACWRHVALGASSLVQCLSRRAAVCVLDASCCCCCRRCCYSSPAQISRALHAESTAPSTVVVVVVAVVVRPPATQRELASHQSRLYPSPSLRSKV